MALKTVFAALVLVAAPAIASASCNWQKQQAQSCETGTSWNAELQRCVTTATS